jgi:hypothetical protein
MMTPLNLKMREKRERVKAELFYFYCVMCDTVKCHGMHRISEDRIK